MGKKLSGKDLIKLGLTKNNAINIALGQINRYRKREKKEKENRKAKIHLNSIKTVSSTRL